MDVPAAAEYPTRPMLGVALLFNQDESLLSAAAYSELASSGTSKTAIAVKAL